MATLPGDGAALWERLRNLHFGAEQAQKAGNVEEAQARTYTAHAANDGHTTLTDAYDARRSTRLDLGTSHDSLHMCSESVEKLW